MTHSKTPSAAAVLDSCWKILGAVQCAEKCVASARRRTAFGAWGRMLAGRKVRRAQAVLAQIQPVFERFSENIRALPQFRDFSAGLKSFAGLAAFVFDGSETVAARGAVPAGRGSPAALTAAQLSVAAERLGKLHNRIQRAADILEQTYVG